MKGEALLSAQQLAVVMGYFTAGVVLVVVVGFIAFKRWKNREELRRGSQIAMAYLDPDCAEISRDRSGSDR